MVTREVHYDRKFVEKALRLNRNDRIVGARIDKGDVVTFEVAEMKNPDEEPRPARPLKAKRYL